MLPHDPVRDIRVICGYGKIITTVSQMAQIDSIVCYLSSAALQNACEHIDLETICPIREICVVCG